MKTKKRTIVALALLAFLISGNLNTSIANAKPKTQTYKEISTPPSDSIDSKNTRVWVPLERVGRCRLILEVFDMNDNKVRTMVNTLMKQGYHNFWWDKRDDSGNYVPAGEYKYVWEDKCGEKKRGTLIANYTKWESACDIEVFKDPWKRGFVLTLRKDSALVSLEAYKYDGDLVDVAFRNRIYNKGRHEYRWTPPDSVMVGLYKLKVTVGDFSKIIKVRNVQ